VQHDLEVLSALAQLAGQEWEVLVLVVCDAVQHAVEVVGGVGDGDGVSLGLS
jgi:hypothetical protein